MHVGQKTSHGFGYQKPFPWPKSRSEVGGSTVGNTFGAKNRENRKKTHLTRKLHLGHRVFVF